MVPQLHTRSRIGIDEVGLVLVRMEEVGSRFRPASVGD